MRDIDSELWTAVWKDDIALIEELLTLGANPNERHLGGWAPLHMAAVADSAVAVRLLLEAGADVNTGILEQGILGNTALMLAALNGHAEVAALLLEHGADPGIKNGDGRSALDMAEDALSCARNPDEMKAKIRETIGVIAKSPHPN